MFIQFGHGLRNVPSKEAIHIDVGNCSQFCFWAVLWRLTVEWGIFGQWSHIGFLADYEVDQILLPY